MRLTLIHGDALKYMKTMDSESVDLILTDPPYNISKNVKITRNGGKFGKAKDIQLDFGEWDKNIISWRDYIDDFARILKPYGVLVMFYDKLEISCIAKYLQERLEFKVRNIGVWIKSNPAPQARRVKWQDGSEFFLIATKNKGTGHHYNYKLGQSPDWFKCSVSYKHYHPTQKPDALIEWIMKYWSYPGDVVFDPFLGSGTTMVVAKKLGRDCIGVEINEKYIDIIKRRVGWSEGLDVEYIEKTVF